MSKLNKLASLEATLVRNSADSLTHLLTGVKCRATSVAKNDKSPSGIWAKEDDKIMIMIMGHLPDLWYNYKTLLKYFGCHTVTFDRSDITKSSLKPI